MRRIGWLLILLGLALVLVSALADPIGVGGASAFGWKQWAGVIVGAVAVLAGAVATRAGTSPPASPSEPS